MENKASSKNGDHLLQAKELQKFFNEIKGVILMPKSKDFEFPMLGVLLSKENYLNFKDYGINKIITNLLDDKFTVLSIKIVEKSPAVGLSIIDKDSGLKFQLPAQPMGQALVTFLEITKYNDKIPMMLGFFDGDLISFEQDIKTNTLLVLDGYVFE